MKGILPLFFCVSLLSSASFAAPAGYNRDLYGDLNIRNRTIGGDMYIGIRGDLSFMNWKNEYKDETDTKLGSDSFSFKTLVGADVFVGYQSLEKWRSDLEFGYIGKYSEGETEYNTNYVTEKAEFNLETFYLMANGYYDFWNGFYGGVGAGLAFVKTSIDSTAVAGDSASSVSPMGAFMIGWSHKLDDKINLDLRYRFAVFHGGDLKLDTGGGYLVKSETGFIKNNSLSLGIRYSF